MVATALRFLGFALALRLAAQPGEPPPMGTTMLQTGSAHYTFEELAFTSADGRRHYRIFLGLPRQPAPAGGYRTLYLLDGNAALCALDEPLLARLASAQPPVLVFLGQATDRQFDIASRIYDYTPRPPGSPTPFLDARGRTQGGAEEFFTWLHEQVQPAVQTRAQLAPHLRALWGHSFGGLFTLHVLEHHGDAFDCYFAASPSLWWNDGYMDRLDERLPASRPAHARLWLHRGSAEETGHHNPAVPAEAARLLAARLQGRAGLTVVYREFAGLDHRASLDASLRESLEIFAALPAPRQAPGENVPRLGGLAPGALGFAIWWHRRRRADTPAGASSPAANSLAGNSD